MAGFVRCKSCKSIFDLSRYLEQCPGCKGIISSNLWSSVEEVKRTDPDYPAEGDESSLALGTASVDPVLAREEYFRCLSIVDGFDQKALTIKAWSVTGSLAAIVTAYTSGKTSLFFIAAIASVIFWLLEAYWKTLQRMYQSRANELEQHLQGKVQPGFCCPATSQRFVSKWSQEGLRTFGTIIFWPHVFLPHLFVAILGLGIGTYFWVFRF